jgi:hypothetical protein
MWWRFCLKDLDLEGFSSGNINFFSGNIYGERSLVDASEWDLHITVVCGCRPSLHRYCLWRCNSDDGGTKTMIFFHTHFYCHLLPFTKTRERCYSSLVVCWQIISINMPALANQVNLSIIWTELKLRSQMIMSGAVRFALIEVQTPTACVPKPPPVYRSEILGLLEFLTLNRMSWLVASVSTLVARDQTGTVH